MKKLIYPKILSFLLVFNVKKVHIFLTVGKVCMLLSENTELMKNNQPIFFIHFKMSDFKTIQRRISEKLLILQIFFNGKQTAAYFFCHLKDNEVIDKKTENIKYD